MSLSSTTAGRKLQPGKKTRRVPREGSLGHAFGRRPHGPTFDAGAQPAAHRRRPERHDARVPLAVVVEQKVGTYDLGMSSTTLEVAQEVARKVTAAAPAKA